jgi:hypothetical protein
MESKAHVGNNEPKKSKPHLILRGLAFAIGVAALVWVAILLLLGAWLGKFEVRPDFGSNGLLWTTTAILTIDLVFLPVFFGIWMMLVVPNFVKLRSENGKFRRDKIFLHLAAAAILVVPRTLLYGASPFDLWIAFTPPALAGALAGSEILIRLDKKAIRRSQD